MLPKAI